MAEPSAPAPPPRNWSGQAADTVVDLVDQVRAKSTGPLLTAAKGLVYGIVIAVLAVVALVLLTVALFRIVDAYLVQEVWLAYFVVGVLFWIVGAVLWSQRRSSVSDSDPGPA